MLASIGQKSKACSTVQHFLNNREHKNKGKKKGICANEEIQAKQCPNKLQHKLL